MKKTFFATTLCASLFLICCDNSGTNASSSFSKEEQYSYAVIYEPSSVPKCSYASTIAKTEFSFDEDNNVTIIETSSEGKFLYKGVYSEEKDKEGAFFYNINLKDNSGKMYNYYPSQYLLMANGRQYIYFIQNYSTMQVLLEKCKNW